MYSKEVTAKNLKRAETLVRQKHSLPAKWQLKEPSEGERAEMRAWLDGVLDQKGVPSRELTREEKLWAFCERNLCKLDFGYYARNYAKIENWQGMIVGFEPNKAQQLILELMAENEEAGVAQMFQLLKARQLGMTTLFQILLSHRLLFFHNVSAITGSASEEKSKEMVGKIDYLYTSLPWWLQPRRSTHRKGELMEFEDINSSLRVQWGNQKTGIGRGSTPTVAHLSELAEFVDPEDLVDASLVRALHENPFAIVGLESTAKGIGNWWHRTWKTMVEMDARRLARLKPVFLPWYLGQDLYPTVSWLRRRPVERGWIPPRFVTQHAEAAKAYVAESGVLRKALGDGWEMGLEQQWFYYVEYEEARQKGILNLFLQEMPATPDEAFQNANPSIFSYETLGAVRNEAQASKPVGVFQLKGSLVSPIYDFGRRMRPEVLSIPLRCVNGDGTRRDDFELEPLVLEGWKDAVEDGKIYVWEWPVEGEVYGIGVDPSEGVEQDSTVIQVVKKATPWHPDEQVVEFASNKIAPHDAWAWVYALAHLYTTRNRDGGWNWPRVVVETNIAAGDAIQTEMLKRGWGNFHQGFEPRKPGKSRTDEIGWRTTRSSRPKLISLARKLIRDQALVIRSPWLAEELSTLEFNIDKQRIEASQGNHDDRFMAMGVVLCSWYDPEVYGSTPTFWEVNRKWEEEVMARPVYEGNAVVGGRSIELTKVGDPPKDSRNLGEFGKELW